MKFQNENRFMLGYDKETHERLSGEVRAELGRHRISIAALSREIGKTRPTISLWLSRNTTQIRYDKMMAAIIRIISKEAL